MRPVVPLLLFFLASCSSGESQVSVLTGPTNIPRGDAVGDADITVNNGLFAVAFAVETAPPWGVARGGIVDIAIVRNGELVFDIASLADFMPNNWSSWPTTYQRVAVESHTDDEVVIRTQRDWGDVDLDTRFFIRAGDSRIRVVTTMTNNGESAHDELLTGYVVWPDGGALIEAPVVASTAEGATGWTAAYDKHWAIGVHAPFANVTAYQGRDRYLSHSLEPGESRRFEAWLQIEGEGALAPMVRTEIEFDGLESGVVRGEVSSSDGKAVAEPAVVFKRDEKLIAWAIAHNGAFDLRLPVGDYDVHATAAGHGASASQSISVLSNETSTVSFNDVQLPGSIRMQVRTAAAEVPADARISIAEGQKPLIAYHGREVFFTELESVGELSAQLPPGDYILSVSSGGGFTSLPQMMEVSVESGATADIAVDVPTFAQPSDRGWYAADLHHHSDVLDGFTEAEFVLRSQLAAGVDLTFLSDHDSVINNAEMQALSERRGMPFIAGTELSPSWGHFNAWPLDEGAEVEIDTGQSTVQEVFVEARRMGADAIAVNHPYSEYGYFNNRNSGSVTGGYDDGFDLVEITPEPDSSSPESQNHRTIADTWALWNQGVRAYLAAGSDAHDVWLQE
ncbi:MAG: CehA/McbA family metallohydrolase, partial [Pseudomonadota bacterium]